MKITANKWDKGALTELAQDTYWWRAVVNVVINVWVP
jgi:hypothetical protein